MAPPLQNQLRALRESKGLTLEQLASAVGTTNQQISHLELGKRQLTVAWLVRLAAALECHPWAIVDGATEQISAADRDLLVLARRLHSGQREALMNSLATIEGGPAQSSGS